MTLYTCHGTGPHEDACTAFLWHWGFLRIDGGWVRLSHVADSSFEEGWTRWALARMGADPGEC